jgi:WD40 repeat protein
VATALAALAVAAFAPAVSAGAAVSQSTVVSDNPANVTPNVVDAVGGTNGTVLKYQQVGSTMYAAGEIGLVQNAARTVSYTRRNLLAFDAVTGAVRTWAPALNKQSTALAATPDGRYLFVGGAFTTVDGVSTRSLVKFDLTTGARVTTFRFAFGGVVNDLELVGGHLVVGGGFPGGLVSVSPDTGAVDGWLDVTLAGKVATDTPTKVHRFAVNPAGTLLVALGNFTSADGQARRQAFQVALSGGGGVVTSWHPPVLDLTCLSGVPFYTRGVDFSPDGSYFVIASSGGPRGGTSVCDAASRWESNRTGAATPTWVNYTGSDSVFSVSVTGAAVYVGGHFRWLDNRNAVDYQAPGAVARSGIGAINPSTGKALAWNPGKTRGHGTEELYASPAGLWIGSDGRYVHGEWREGVAFMPLP